MRLIDELESLVHAFDVAGIDYALCGGLAMAVHGHARATEDIDILLREESLSEAIKAAVSVGFTFETGWLKFRDGTSEEQKLFRVLKPHSSGSLILDLLIVTPALEPVWNQRQQFKRGDRSLSVVSSDGLIDMKRLSGRQRDLSDIERLTGASDD